MWTYAELAKLAGCTKSTLKSRLERGWSVEDAVTTKVNFQGPYKTVTTAWIKQLVHGKAVVHRGKLSMALDDMIRKDPQRFLQSIYLPVMKMADKTTRNEKPTDVDGLSELEELEMESTETPEENAPEAENETN
jgi:hypothetical protein